MRGGKRENSGRKPGYAHEIETRRRIAEASRRARPRKPVADVVSAIWDGRTLEDIAFEQGVSQQAISSRIARWGLTKGEIDAMRWASENDKAQFLESI